ALLLVSFIFSIRVFPSFAEAVSRIPVLEQLVRLIDHDPGLQSAIENEFMQPIGITKEHNGVRFTLDGIIVDEGRMNIFYTVESPESYVEAADIRNFSVKHLDGKGLSAGISYN